MEVAAVAGPLYLESALLKCRSLGNVVELPYCESLDDGRELSYVISLDNVAKLP